MYKWSSAVPVVHMMAQHAVIEGRFYRSICRHVILFTVYIQVCGQQPGTEITQHHSHWQCGACMSNSGNCEFKDGNQNAVQFSVTLPSKKCLYFRLN